MRLSMDLEMYKQQDLLSALIDIILMEMDNARKASFTDGEFVGAVFDAGELIILKELATDSLLVRLKFDMNNDSSKKTIFRIRNEIAIPQEDLEDIQVDKIMRSLRALCIAAKRQISSKLAELAEIDWRPTETISEDFYTA